MLPLVRELDATRVVMLNSGRFDLPAGAAYGSLSNPGSRSWDGELVDQHPYPQVPHRADTIQSFRGFGGGKPVFISEYGIGSAVDLVRVARHYERFGKAGLEDARFYGANLDRFLNDWYRWRLDEAFGRPEDYFAACVAKMAGQRLHGLNAIRANAYAAAYSMTGTVDQGMSGEGTFTTFRELKPGAVDAIFDGWAPAAILLVRGAGQPLHRLGGPFGGGPRQ